MANSGNRARQVGREASCHPHIWPTCPAPTIRQLSAARPFCCGDRLTGALRVPQQEQSEQQEQQHRFSACSVLHFSSGFFSCGRSLTAPPAVYCPTRNVRREHLPGRGWKMAELVPGRAGSSGRANNNRPGPWVRPWVGAFLIFRSTGFPACAASTPQPGKALLQGWRLNQF